VERRSFIKKEDEYLRDYVEETKEEMHEDTRWNKISQKMHHVGYSKSAKQCRERSSNQLDAPS